MTKNVWQCDFLLVLLVYCQCEAEMGFLFRQCSLQVSFVTFVLVFPFPYIHVCIIELERALVVSVFSNLVELWESLFSTLYICSFGNLVWFKVILVICSQLPCGFCSVLWSHSTTASHTPLICTFRCSLFHPVFL